MISRNEFVEIMNKLAALEEKIDRVDEALQAFGDMNGLFIPDIYDIVVPALESQFSQREAHWLEYFMYETIERGTGEIYEQGENEPPTILNNWGEIYDFLIRLED